jgi:hypothetical protein
LWSNGKESYIATNPGVFVDNNPATIINSGANHMTVKSTQEKIGFCWNCNPFNGFSKLLKLMDCLLGAILSYSRDAPTAIFSG